MSGFSIFRIQTRGWLWVLLPILLQGCATSGPDFREVSPAQDGRPVVYVYRESRMQGAAGSFAIYLNGKELGKLKNGGYFQLTLDSGPNVLSNQPTFGLINVIPWVAVLTALSKVTVDWEKEGALLIEAKPQATYYVQWMLGGSMHLRTRDEAMPVLSTTKRLSIAEVAAEPPK
jgi:hypothetical protein